MSNKVQNILFLSSRHERFSAGTIFVGKILRELGFNEFLQEISSDAKASERGSSLHHTRRQICFILRAGRGEVEP